MTLFVDPQGRIRARHLGALSERALRTRVATLLQALQHEAAVPAAATLLAGCGLNGDLATLQGLRHGAGLEAVRADAMAREWVQA